MSAVVAVDQGKSGTRAEARVESGASVHGRSPGSVLGSTGADAVIDAVTSLRLPSPPAVVSVGTTAAPETQAGRAQLAAELRDRLGAGRVLVTEDAVTAHLGAFRGAAGVVVSAGTGAIALWSDGVRSVRIDGWGPILGDHGGGVAIGGAGLRAAYSAVDGRGPSTSLVPLARSHLGGLGLDAARALQGAANPAEVVSAFAVTVLRCAEDGDAVAVAIVDRAASDLATSAALAARPALESGARPRCCAVGQLMRNPHLRAAFTRCATERGLAVDPSPAGSLAGAMYLAVHGPTVAFRPLIGTTV